MTDYSPSPKKTPDIYIHAKVAHGIDTRIGPRIGVGFLHSDGIGINIILEAQPIPVNGQIELVGFAPKTES